jgi:hypothetical protein
MSATIEIAGTEATVSDGKWSLPMLDKVSLGWQPDAYEPDPDYALASYVAQTLDGQVTSAPPDYPDGQVPCIFEDDIAADEIDSADDALLFETKVSEAVRRIFEHNTHHDPHSGRFSRGGGSRGPAKGSAGGSSPVDARTEIPHLSRVSERAFTGSPVPQRRIMTKQDTGKIAENVALGYLHQFESLPDAKHANSLKSNFPVDLTGDHPLPPIKGGNIGNSKGAQQWRLTIGEPSKAEKAAIKKMTPMQKAAWNARKDELILERKTKAMKDLEQRLGHPIKPRTITAIINHDTRTADLFSFDGFHPRVGWTTKQAKDAYVGTFRF